MTTTTHSTESVRGMTLFVAFELGAKQWKVALASTVESQPWVRGVRAGDWMAVQRLLGDGRRRFGLAAEAPVVSCYEAGRDGFWIHRALRARGISNRVVDSASIEVNRRARRRKTDRIDAVKLVLMLMRAAAGERHVWSEVRVPTVAEEAARVISRERTQLVTERTRRVNQMRGWLTTWGGAWPSRRTDGWWTAVRDWAGEALPVSVQQRLARAQARVHVVTAQLAALEAQQQATVTADPVAARLAALKGLAPTSVSVLLQEGLVWRQFRNRRQVGGFLGYTAVPFQSGDTHQTVGIDRAGNRRLRTISLQLAWQWVRWQPASALTQWYRRRFGEGRRPRLTGIVAVARKLVIALWRDATTNEVPPGAIVKTA
jgi:transposase